MHTSQPILTLKNDEKEPPLQPKTLQTIKQMMYNNAIDALPRTGYERNRGMDKIRKQGYNEDIDYIRDEKILGPPKCRKKAKNKIENFGNKILSLP